MLVDEIRENIYLVDLETAGTHEFVASYILTGDIVAIIEAGPMTSASNLLATLEELCVEREQVSYIVLSHIHLDHGGAAGFLMKHLPKARLLVHMRGVKHLVSPNRLWKQSRDALGKIAQLYGEPQPVPEGRIVSGTEGMTLDLGRNLKLRILETVGHASHHLSYYEASNEIAFTGDSAGVYLRNLDLIVPTTPAPFYMDATLNSLEKLIGLKPKALCYSHFGMANNATDNLQTYKRQLKLWLSIARDGLSEGENTESIRRKIIQRDETLQRAARYISQHPILSQTVFNQSVEGFIKYVDTSTSQR
jgi:hydroxyacylglutathione hydrolase